MNMCLKLAIEGQYNTFNEDYLRMLLGRAAKREKNPFSWYNSATYM